MSKFAFLSTKSSAHKSILLLILAALIGYGLPWVVGYGAGLTFNGYDLAEWASLNPITHATNPQMLPSLLLRMQLTLITLIIALLAGRRFVSISWWLCALLVGLLVIAQLPPFEFFTVARGDTNYGQQFMLTIISLIGGGVGLSGIVYRWRTPIMILLALIGIGSGVLGYIQSLELVKGFNLSSTIGVGIVMFVVGYGLVTATLGWQAIKNGDKS
jgi:hypothetical protein